MGAIVVWAGSSPMLYSGWCQNASGASGAVLLEVVLQPLILRRPGWSWLKAEFASRLIRCQPATLTL